ncbi:endonuclease/exonuclease/phosphatase family protein [Sphingobacterium tabacisoli]|uniref:Endonuclease/exonuclease/phosphatase family protein n=1 Tax=Sphingobacterium tabacisoli TaxID=2044855 RepID=A0ABW5L2Q5_9SPHI|nr:endonuclease/exonuclease/phosphatase family protein [Sphingobacterium tabacisoli]
MKKIFFTLLGICAVLVLTLSCSKTFDAGDWEVTPTKFRDPNEYTGPTKTLKIMSVNMNLSSTATNFPVMVEMIKAYDPDLLFLRQCDSKTTRAGGIDRPQVIADELKMEVFMKGRSYNGGQFGNAVLSKFPITERFGLDLTKDPGRGEQRMLAMIKVEVEPGVFVQFAGTELETNADDRRSQAIDIIRATEKLTDPVILAGNFNEQWAEPGDALTYITGNFKYACASAGCVFNAPKAKPTGTFDYVTYQDPGNLLIVNKDLEAFKNPETANTFFPTTAEIKVKTQKKENK